MKQFLTHYFDVLKKHSFDQNIHFYEYPRIHESQPYSVHLKMRFDSARTYHAWGNGFNADEAYGKAFMELIERYIFGSFSPFIYSNVFGLLPQKKSLAQISKDYKIDIKYLHPTNTNGVAIHSKKRNAIQSAMFELLERHTILYAILDEIPPNRKLHQKITENRSCDFYIWNGPLNTYVVVAAFQKNQGWYFSSSCSYSLNEAIKKATLEVNSFLCLNDTVGKTTNFDIKEDDIDSFNRYHRYSGDQRVIEFFNLKSDKKIPNLKKKDFYFTLIPQPNIFNGLIPFPCVRVINPHVQQLFFDNWKPSNVNPLLFDKSKKLPDFPHIIA